MAITKVSRGLLNTGVSDSSDATAITIDSNENVLIGTTSGSDPLVVSDSGASSITARFINTNADANPANIRLQKNSSSPADGDYLGMINVSGNTETGAEVIFQSVDFISTDVSDSTEDGVIAFRTRRAGGLAERMRIGTNVGIGVTSPDSRLQISNEDGSTYRFGYGGTSDIYFDADAVRFRTDNGGAMIAMLDTDGLKFGSDSAEANALDDYEEGTWTPSSSSNGTVSNAQGFYVKIGKMVHVLFYFSLSGVSTSTSVNVAGMPFAVQDNIGPSNVGGTGAIFGDSTNFLAFAQEASSLLTIEYDRPISGTQGTSANLRGSVTYMTAL